MTEQAGAVPLMRLPISGWTVRVGRGAADRAALEVYEGARLADVCVTTSVSVSVLRGAWRGPRGSHPWGLAWGQLPAGVRAATVEFTAARREPVITPVAAVVIEGVYWVAEAAGDFTGVTVHAGPVLLSGRLRRTRGR